jgi:sphingolipid 8-(E)-desaturase
MKKFQIGKIDGPWHNFIPPIQGGDFLSKRLKDSDEYQDERQESRSLSATDELSSSESESRESMGPLRRRRVQESLTPLSSVSSVDPAEEVTKNSAAHIDLLTQQYLDLDNAKYPATDLFTQQYIIERYRDLYTKLMDGGYFECNYMAYGREIIRYTLLFLGFILFLRLGWYALSGLFLGLLWHQLVFTVHDAGHMGITHNFTIDTVIGMTIASYIGGLSLGWWKRNHNVHHIVTNSPEHDPDIEHMPFFMVSHRFFKSLRSTYYDRVMEYDAFAKIMAVYQKYLYYPILLFGRFNLYRLSWVHLLWGQGPRKGPARWHRWYEIMGNVFFWYWFGYQVVYRSIPTVSGRVAFVLVSHIVTAPLHLQITLSHFAMSTSDLGVDESFAQKMLRTTMDVDCPEWLDFIHGGLQFQAIHHLYPRMPRHNLRKAQALVQDFCSDVGIPYALYGFIDGNKQVIGRLADVGRQAKILAQCRESVVQQMVNTGSSDLH